jgi:hypothetical protein
MAIRECWVMQKHKKYCDGILKLAPSWGKCSNVLDELCSNMLTIQWHKLAECNLTL